VACFSIIAALIARKVATENKSMNGWVAMAIAAIYSIIFLIITSEILVYWVIALALSAFRG
jgi:branched-subunit amino acid transport protein